MTADIYPFDAAFLSGCATRIINEVKGINRVVYDYTSKPPGRSSGSEFAQTLMSVFDPLRTLALYALYAHSLARLIGAVGGSHGLF